MLAGSTSNAYATAPVINRINPNELSKRKIGIENNPINQEYQGRTLKNYFSSSEYVNCLRKSYCNKRIDQSSQVKIFI